MKIVCLLVVVLALATNGFGQLRLGKSYLMASYDDKTSLPQNSVRSILFDKHGFMWLGTELGLVRFDGQNFNIYNKSTNPGIITSNRIQALAFLHDSLICLDGDYHAIYINSDCLELKLVTTIKPWESFFWNPNGVDLREIRQKFKGSPALPTGIGAVFLLPDNSVYSMETYINFFFIKGDKATIGSLPPNLRPEVAFQHENSVYVLAQNGQFIELRNGTVHGSVSLLGELATKLKKGSRDPALYVRFFSGSGYNFVQVQNQLFSITVDKQSIQSQVVIDSLPYADIQSMAYVDSLGIYCIGTYTEGLHILRQKHFSAIMNPTPGINLNNNYAQLLLFNGNIFTSTGFEVDSFGHFKEHLQQDLVTRYTALMTSSKQTYIGYKHNIIQGDSNLQQLQHALKIDQDIRALFESTDHGIWFAVGEALHNISDSKDKMFALMPSGSVIETIFQKGKTEFWVGTRKGLFSVNLTTNLVSPFTQFDSLYVRTINATKDGAIWIGTYGDGYFVFNDGKFVKMPMDEQGYLLTAHCFVEDKNGFLWIPTNKGLFQFLIADLLSYTKDRTLIPFYKYYDETYGFNTNEFNGGCIPCAVQRKNGQVSLPSLKGLVWYNPNEMKHRNVGGEIFTDLLVVGNDTLLCPNDKSSLRVEYASNEITCRFNSPNIGDNHRIRYEYFLEGEMTQWMPVQKTTLFLRKLSSGTHKLSIRKQNGFGIGNYSYRKFEIYVSTPWYATIWFITIAIALVWLIVRFIIRQRVKYLQQQNKKLEAIIYERTADLKQSNEMKDKLTTILIHDIRSPLRFISLFASHINKELNARDNPDPLLEAAADLRKATDEVYNFVDESVIWIKAQQKGYAIQKKSFQLFGLISELEDFFRALLKENNNQMTNEVDPAFAVESYREILKVILRNFIDNSNKYISNGNIIIRSQKAPSKAYLIIEDDGPGMSEDLIRYLEDPSAEDSDVHIGLGFRIIKEMLGIIEGKVAIASSTNGTRISIKLN